MNSTYRQIWLAYHVRKIDELRQAYDRDPGANAHLLAEIDRHKVAVQQIDRGTHERT